MEILEDLLGVCADEDKLCEQYLHLKQQFAYLDIGYEEGVEAAVRNRA